ncbi:salicylate carboxymethyltransferase [Quercus suber]|uniref:Salicylate carboxymethyltransferase n=1 Tax=Quercus suber TaxID=58331 RepID=A0AAW0K6V3_QUESU
MVSGGHMVLTIIGSDRKADSSGNHSCTIWELLGITLNDMVQEIQNPLCLLFPSAETRVLWLSLCVSHGK